MRAVYLDDSGIYTDTDIKMRVVSMKQTFLTGTYLTKDQTGGEYHCHWYDTEDTAACHQYNARMVDEWLEVGRVPGVLMVGAGYMLDNGLPYSFGTGFGKNALVGVRSGVVTFVKFEPGDKFCPLVATPDERRWAHDSAECKPEQALMRLFDLLTLNPLRGDAQYLVDRETGKFTYVDNGSMLTFPLVMEEGDAGRALEKLLDRHPDTLTYDIVREFAAKVARAEADEVYERFVIEYSTSVNRDWTKRTWDLPDPDSDEFKSLMNWMGISDKHLRRLPAWRLAGEAGTIPGQGDKAVTDAAQWRLWVSELGELLKKEITT